MDKMKIIGAITIALWCTAVLCSASPIELQPINPVQGDLQEEPLDLAGEPLAVEREQRQVPTEDITGTFTFGGVTCTIGRNSFSCSWPEADLKGMATDAAAANPCTFTPSSNGFTVACGLSTNQVNFPGANMAQVITTGQFTPAALTSTSAVWQLQNMAFTFVPTGAGNQLTFGNLGPNFSQVSISTLQSAVQVIRVPDASSIPCVGAAGAGAGGLGAVLAGLGNLPGAK